MALIKTPLTDIGGYILNYQGNTGSGHEFCRILELQFFKCMEAAGAPNWKRSCKDEHDDVLECVTKRKEMERMICIKNERERQYRNGTLKEKSLPNPELHSYGQPHSKH